MPPPFTDTHPSPLLRDFDLLLDALGAAPAPLTASQNLGRKWLFAMNAKISTPQTGVSEKTDQKYYLLLNLFYWICLESGLCSIKEGGKLPVFEPNAEKVARFRQLGREAQYFFLLETYLTCCDTRLMNDNNHIYTVYFLLALPQIAAARAGKKIPLGEVDYKNPLSFISSSLGCHGLYFQFFGLWEVEREDNSKEYRKTYLRFKSLSLSDFGKFFFQKIVDKKLLLDEEDDSLDEDELLNFEDTNAFLYLPKRLHEYFAEDFSPDTFAGMPPVREKVPEVEGNYIFKVSLKHAPTIWRKIALAHDHTLEDLHNMIQRAFKFDNDHLFCFYLNPRNEQRDKYYGPSSYGELSPFAEDAIIGQLGLVPGRKFSYLFDFGDNWRFDVVLEAIESDKKPLKQPAIVEKQGKAPKQYRDDW